MQYFHVKIYQGSWVGDKHYPVFVEKDTVYGVLAADQPAAMKVFSGVVSEYASQDRSFEGGSVDFNAVMKKNFAQSESDRKRGIMSDIERHLRRLVDKASNDLGSIVIDSAFVAITDDNNRLLFARFEAREGERRRVVYLDDPQSGILQGLVPSVLVDAIQAKF